MKVLNLFSGTGSVSKPFRENGHEVIDLDIDGNFNAEIVTDILKSLDFVKLTHTHIGTS